jgi:hypothetical protein
MQLAPEAVRARLHHRTYHPTTLRVNDLRWLYRVIFRELSELVLAERPVGRSGECGVGSGERPTGSLVEGSWPALRIRVGISDPTNPPSTVPAW